MLYYSIKNHETEVFKHFGQNIFLEKTLNMLIKNKKNNLQNSNVRDTQRFIITTESIYLVEQKENKQGFTLVIWQTTSLFMIFIIRTYLSTLMTNLFFKLDNITAALLLMITYTQ